MIERRSFIKRILLACTAPLIVAPKLPDHFKYPIGQACPSPLAQPSIENEFQWRVLESFEYTLVNGIWVETKVNVYNPRMMPLCMGPVELPAKGPEASERTIHIGNTMIVESIACVKSQKGPVSAAIA